MIVFDAHEDLAWNALTFGRDYTCAAHETRRVEAANGSVAPRVNGVATVGLPDWLLGRVAVVVGVLFVSPARRAFGAWDAIVYHDPQEAYAQAIRQMDYYRRLDEASTKISLVERRPDLDAVLGTWADGTDLHDHRVGLILSIEGADSIIEPKQAEEWYARGVRAVGLAWAGTRYAGGTGEPGPLTDLGRALLEVMGDLGMVLDLSHAAEAAYFEALDRYEGAVIASHSNPRRFCPSDRGLSDEMIARMVERGGAIGIVPYNGFLKPGWRRSDRKDAVRLADVVDAIDHVCQVAGNARHVGIGSDFDGGFGAGDIPEEFDTVADLWQLGAALAARGYAPDDIEAILGGNFLRIYQAALPA
ncbi:MAG: membrane dipeptidase [Anaerolineae bacterium]|nr:membrane dipeptidase [Anaerolineae bacterium]